MKGCILALLCMLSCGLYASETSHHFNVNITMGCPDSPEFQAFMASVPPADFHSANYEEWKTHFVGSMAQLIHLVESGKVFNSSWSVNAGDGTSTPVDAD